MFNVRDRKKLLIVDDDTNVLRTLKIILEKKGYDVLAFENPELALEQLKKEQVDLILTDLKMPQMDGIQFLYRAKEIRARVPVILITAFATIDTAVSAIKWGAFDYLKKPFDLRSIYDVVQRAIESSKK